MGRPEVAALSSMAAISNRWATQQPAFHRPNTYTLTKIRVYRLTGMNGTFIQPPHVDALKRSDEPSHCWLSLTQYGGEQSIMFTVEGDKTTTKPTTLQVVVRYSRTPPQVFVSSLRQFLKDQRPPNFQVTLNWKKQVLMSHRHHVRQVTDAWCRKSRLL